MPRVDLASFAARYLQAGLAVLPARRERKQPAVTSWKKYQDSLPTLDDIDRWFVKANPDALCIVCGVVSGNLEVLDFDQKAILYKEWAALVRDEAPGLFERLVIERSQSGGIHVLYRSTEPVGGNAVLAAEINDAVHATLIETRGEGGLILCAPTPGYELLQGQLHALPVLSGDEVETLRSAASALDRRTPTMIPDTTSRSSKSERDRPGDRFNREGDLRPTLERHGWRRWRPGANEYWTRPGKAAGVSATFNGECFFVHSSNAAPFEHQRGYSKFTAFTLLEHGGDFRKAAKALRRESPPPVVNDDSADADGVDGDALVQMLGKTDPRSGRIALSPAHTLPTARAFIDRYYSHEDGPTLHYTDGAFYAWQNNRYIAVEDAALRQRLQQWLHTAVTPRMKVRSGDVEFTTFCANPRTVHDALAALQMHAHIDGADGGPRWIGEQEEAPPPRELLCFPALTLHIPSRRAMPPTPRLFVTNALEYDYDAVAPAPVEWLRFLRDLFGDDAESVELLQEWFGYCLVPDTRLQKMLLIVGPPRSGKGTIGRVLSGVVGQSNVAGPTVGSLASRFGLHSLVGKSIAIVSDARFSGHDSGTLVERLLCISGEDLLTIDRKYLSAVTLRLTTRMMFLSNEIPQLADASGALASRFLILRLTESHLGREDEGLLERLIVERAGILLWALEGLDRLRARGRFKAPASTGDIADSIRDGGSAIHAFLRDRCQVGEGLRIEGNALFEEWKSWCATRGVQEAQTIQRFGVAINAACPSARRRRTTGGAGFYEGLRIKEASP